jgi:hypothetical protein
VTLTRCDNRHRWIAEATSPRQCPNLAGWTRRTNQRILEIYDAMPTRQAASTQPNEAFKFPGSGESSGSRNAADFGKVVRVSDTSLCDYFPKHMSFFVTINTATRRVGHS